MELRLILDMKRVNEAFRPPPWTPLTGPGAMAGLDLREPQDEGWSLHGACGDVSNFFYWLGTTPFLVTFFVFEGATPQQLREHLIGSGWKGPLPSKTAKHIAVAVSPMGWSWAVWTAQNVIKDVVLGPEQALVDPESDPSDPTCITPDRIMIQGAPSPLMGTTGATRGVVVVLYVDDFGFLVFENGKWRWSKGGARRLRDLATARLRAHGLIVHKETEGPPILLVGILVGGPKGEALPRTERLWEGIIATQEVVRRRAVPVEWIASLVGFWCWNMLLCRATLSVLDHLYVTIRAHPPG